MSANPSPIQPEPTLQKNAVAKLIEQYTLDPIRGARIDLSGLRHGEKLLAILGYVFCGLMLFLSLLLDWVGKDVDKIQFPFTAANTPHEMQPTVALFGLLGYPLGWAFVLMGAGHARKTVFYIVLAVYALYSGIAAYTTENITAYCLAPIVVVLLFVVHLLAKKFGLFTRVPLLVFIVMAVLTIVHALFTFFLANDLSAFGQNLYGFFRLFNFLAFPLWMYGGLSLINFALSVSRGVLQRLGRGYAPENFVRFAQRVLIAHLVLYVGIYLVRIWFTPELIGRFSPLISIIVSTALLLVMFLLKSKAKWNMRNAALLLCLSVAFGIFVIIVNGMFRLGFNASDPLNATLDKLGVLPSGTFFMFTLVIGILGSFVPFANGESAALPRRARVFIAIGFAILFIAMMFIFLFTVNTEEGSNYTSSPIFTGLTVFGALAIGLPFLAWVLLKQQDGVVGSHADWQGGLGLLQSTSALARLLSVVVLLAPLLLTLANRLIIFFGG